MPKLEMKPSFVDAILFGATLAFVIDPSWEYCVPILAFSMLKALAMYLPKQDSLSDQKAQELEDKIAILKKEITATRMRIGLER